jgi:hypothetical protein
LLCLSLILSLAAFFRLWQVGESLWIDELHTSWVVSGKLSDVLPRAAMGNQSPLYFWGMWLLVQLTGQTEWTLRLPSLVAGIALPAAVNWLVLQLRGRGQENPLPPGEGGWRSQPGEGFAALAAALLVAIDPTCIFYAQEARPYAWVMLLAVVELMLLRRLIEQPTIGRRTALLANSLILFYLHYTTAIFLAGIVALLPMLVRVTRSPYPTKSLAIDLLLAAALAAPGVVQMSDIFERRANWEAFVDEPSWQALFTRVPFAGWAMLGAAIVALAQLVPRVLPGNALTRGSASSAPSKSPPAPNVLWYSVLLSAILLPLILSWSITALNAARIYHVRYLVALVPLAAAATCLASTWIPWRIVQTTVLVALAVWHLYDGRMLDQFARDGRFLNVRNEEWRGAVSYLNEQLPQSAAALLIVDSDLIESLPEPKHDSRWSLSDDLQYHSYVVRGIYQVAIDPQVITVFPDVMGAGRVATSWNPPTGRREVWAVARGDEDRIQQRIKDLIQQSPFVVIVPDGRPVLTLEEHRRFGAVHVLQFACSHDNLNQSFRNGSDNRNRVGGNIVPMSAIVGKSSVYVP